MNKFLPLLFLVGTSFLIAADPSIPHSNSIHKSSIQEWKFFDVNALQATINSSGPYCDYLKTNSPGLFWLKGGTKTPVYTSGIWVIGKHRPTSSLRTAVQYYYTEFQPGPIKGTFNTTTNSNSAAADPTDKRYQIYKIIPKDSLGGNPNYDNWPGDLGAPYVDVNRDGTWTAGVDKPEVLGDQQLWCVYNDANVGNHYRTGVTQPMGIEIQTTYYGYEKPAVLENTMFIRWKIINKSDAAYDSLFIGLFSDFDLGDGNDDVDGYDTTLSMAYVFNGDNNDEGKNGYGVTPPAEGTIFLGGTPEVHPYAYPIWNKSGDGDPPLGNLNFPAYAFHFLKGLTSITGEPNINPVTSLPDRFAFSGDPVTNTGWTRSSSGYLPEDRRSLLSLGPITLAPGDTQEVNAAYVISPGVDRLASVEQLRSDAALIRAFFHANLNLPKVDVQKVLMNDSIRLSVSITPYIPGTHSIDITIFSEHTNDSLTSLRLYDDGTHGDVNGSDGLFATNITLPASPYPVRFDAVITTEQDGTLVWKKIAEHIPLSIVHLSSPVIFSDDLNKDGRANPGENVRFGVTIGNPQNFMLPPTVLSNAEGQITGISFPAIAARDSAVIPYNVQDDWTFLSLTLPENYTDTTYNFRIAIWDYEMSRRIDSISIPVHPVVKIISPVTHSEGNTNFEFEVIITDKNALKDHLYVLRGVDSGYYNYGFQLKDSTINTVVIPPQRLNFYNYNGDDLRNHLIPITDGFKIRLHSSYTYPSIESEFLTPSTSSWFGTYLWYPSDVSPRSSIPFAYTPNSVVKFSPIHSFIDNNGNNLIDPGEQYIYDSTDTERTQKAYLYTLSGFQGFITVPFAVYDTSHTSPAKRNIVLRRYDSLDRDSRWNFKKDGIYVMGGTYDESGSLFDPTRNGLNLSGPFALDGLMPWYYGFRTSAYAMGLNDTIDLLIKYTPGFSSRDAFIFNPTLNHIDGWTAPDNYILFQNFPNPFNPATTIRYSLPKQALASITIYNILGQKIRTVVNEVKNAGTYEVEWNGRSDRGISVASGIYFYRLKTEGSIITKKMLMLK